jgi:hypothetical protein
MSVSCWWCGISNKSAEGICSHCDAPLDQKMQGVSKAGFWGNSKTIVWEALILLAVLITLISNLEKFGQAESTPSYSNPVTRSSPSPTPSSTPKSKQKSSSHRSQSINKEYPLLPTENAPSPNIQADTLSPNSRTTIIPKRSSTSSSSGYILGPRGGCYYYSSSGSKVYVDHSYCY